MQPERMAVVRRSLGMYLLALLFVPWPATAHSNSVETNPAHGARLATLPAEATLTFNESPKTIDVVLAGPDGEVNQLTPQIHGPTIKVRLPAAGPRGAYTLSYRVVSADGHPVSGSVGFRVAKGPAPATATRPAAPATAAPTQTAQSDRGPLAPVVIGLGVLGFVAMVLVARSVRR